MEHNLRNWNTNGKIGTQLERQEQNSKNRRQLEIWNIALKIGTQLEKLERKKLKNWNTF